MLTTVVGSTPFVDSVCRIAERNAQQGSEGSSKVQRFESHTEDDGHSFSMFWAERLWGNAQRSMVPRRSPLRADAALDRMFSLDDEAI